MPGPFVAAPGAAVERDGAADMRKLLYGLAGVVIVAVAAAVFLPSLIDLRALVQPVLQSVKEQTGR